ncbi:MAG: hypothetical protein KA717_33225 [Woronichinia naegeliana WA131]|uniref:Uncharacterized protein n=1 Tax=Woronichinia naegeliana WA131 TaxID=2824559 RepID=A0A977KXT8_9CYAN|nr:MAG: hypothetical protein KA717_33225 [Woronichinia naegeliana WA131]
MYRKQQYSIETPENLKNLFGGQLDEENRWIERVRPLVDKSCCNQGSTGNPY